MSKTTIDKAFIGKFVEKADAWLKLRGLARKDVLKASEVWIIVGDTQMLVELFRSDMVVSDSEVQRALEIVFPKALFKST